MTTLSSTFRLSFTHDRTTSSATSTNQSGTTSWFQAEMMLTRGSIAIEDAVQVEGSAPPVVGIVTGLWNRDTSSAERVTKSGLFATRLIIRIEGIDPSWFRTSLILVPAPLGAVPSPQPPAQTSMVPSAQLAAIAQLPEFAQQLLHSLPGNADTTSVHTTTSSLGTVYTTTSSTNSFTFSATRDGQPIQTYDQETADGIGPILMAVGDNPTAVVQALQQWCGMGVDSAGDFLLTIPAPIPDLHPLNEAFLDGLVVAFRQAGADVLAPGPDASIRALARKAAAEVNSQ